MPAEYTRKQRREILEKKRRRRKRRKMILLVRAIIRLLLIIATVVCLGKLLFAGIRYVASDRTDVGENFVWQLANQEEEKIAYIPESEAKLTKPVKRDLEEIYRTLAELAEDNKDYQEIYENWELYPELLLGALCNTPDMLPFVQEYLENDGQAHGALSEEEKSAEIPLLMQWDKRWGYVKYGDECIALLGCAPTSLSMVTIGLTDNYEVTPDEVANYATQEGYYVEGTGTAWSLMTEGCEHFGIKGQEISLDEVVLRNHLSNGEYIICSMRPGDFTTQGHFIVITGAEDGGFTVHDANSRERSQVLWSYETLASQIKNLWAFSKL